MKSYVLGAVVLNLDVAWGALKIKKMSATKPEEEWVPKDWYWPEAKSNGASENRTNGTLTKKRKTQKTESATGSATASGPDPTAVDSPAPVFEMWPAADPQYYELAQLKKPIEDPRGKCKTTGLCEMKNGAGVGMAAGMGVGLLLEYIEGKMRDKPKDRLEKAIDQALWMFSTGYLTSTLLAEQGRKKDEEFEAGYSPNDQLFYDKYRPEDVSEEVLPAKKSTNDYYRYKIPLESETPLNDNNMLIINPAIDRRFENKWLTKPELESISSDISGNIEKNPTWHGTVSTDYTPFADDMIGARPYPVP